MQNNAIGGISEKRSLTAIVVELFLPVGGLCSVTLRHQHWSENAVCYLVGS